MSIDLEVYARLPPKKMIIIPIIILLIALSILGFSYLRTGEPVAMGVAFKGGTVAYLTTDESDAELEVAFADYNLIDVRTSSGRKMVQFGPMDEDTKDRLLAYINSNYPDAQIEDMGEEFSREQQHQALWALLIAFILMAVVVFIVFRTAVPALAVILSAFSDIVIAVACMNIFGIELTLGTVAALLMLIGYSVDSDILLTTRLLKREGSLEEKIIKAMKTGFTMTGTTLSAITVLFLVSTSMYLISSYTAIPILRDISVVLIFGLLADLMNTWLLNTGILKWYALRVEAKKELERKSKRGKKAGKKR
ncbi:MAG: preprotein translocase subunit SecF [Candidatus Syntrophoarchaeum caldarius]|uniref:Protein-export membrane protein SecF n=1 Tax=Candidatus Syntropharchaeum caldarium TaxID=1838285 RepID=A0A1F2P936_9EURY|nr:MAG: preprotein translocase subunit SecF [Candidatus Syntrophoarchaeum caldarius]